MRYTPDLLACRQWHSRHIHAYVDLLARRGYHELLTSLEPLHTIAEDSPAGTMLWSAYNVAVGLPDVAERAMVLARERWPEDERLLRML